MIEINLLLIFIIIAAIVAVEVKDLLSSVVAVGVAGFGLVISFLTLKAPDLAITQLVVEILCLIILIRATIKVDLPFSTSGRWLINTLVSIAFIAVFLSYGYKALLSLPVFGSPLMKTSDFYLSETLKSVHATNIVSAINLNFRAYDTLGEATVLFAAAIGVMSIMRRKGRLTNKNKDNESE
ncbi:MAG: hydrogen gas-evolving membrane-bound hydrogenase subunit E [Candidatus Omnitrophota bacterium]|jgi:multisubunit Na+/H+ antiporter MnhB subunit